MAVDFSKEVDHVARLARLALDEEEKQHMAVQLRDILEIARRVQELDTSGVEPTAHGVIMPVLFRDDEVAPSLPLNRVLQNARIRQKDCFKVPRIAD